MNGRRYRLASPPWAGTHARRGDERAQPLEEVRLGQLRQRQPAAPTAANRAAFSSGRNGQMEPSACRFAFMPSKISCA